MELSEMFSLASKVFLSVKKVHPAGSQVILQNEGRLVPMMDKICEII